MLKHRLLLGPVLILGVVFGVWLDEFIDGTSAPGWIADLIGRETFPPGVIAFLVLTFISFLGARELAAILKDKGITASRRYTCFAALLGLCVSCLLPAGLTGVPAGAVVSSATALVLIGSMVFYSRNEVTQGVVAAAGGALLAYVYLGLMFGFLLAIRREHTAWMLLWVLMTTKSCDIGAYFTGRAIGKHKMIPWLSPKKTWEGLAGGVVTSGLVGAGGAWLMERYAGDPVTFGVLGGAIGGVVFGFVGQGGDLLASLLKRDAGVKDSSRILPGYGGVLDVIDSPLAVLPVAYWWLHWA